jgi:squalene-hopene/tetraprenyl-beta-curcumene cyclase
MWWRERAMVACLAGCVLGMAGPAGADEHSDRARAMIAKAVSYLKAQQDAATGGWSVPRPESRRPVLPAITALVVTAMLDAPPPPPLPSPPDAPAAGAPEAAGAPTGAEATKESIARGVKYVLGFRQADGGIYDRILPSYNTAIALSMLARLDSDEARSAIKPAQDFLRKLQWSESSDPAVGGAEAGRPVDRDHPFYGGIGYGSGGRPDLSNLGIMLQGLHDSGVPGDDPAFQRAIVFLQRCQMDGAINDQDYAKGSRQGGFIYSTSENRESVGSGESKARMIEETLDDGTRVSRLRAYGSMTYTGFKSYVYARLPRDDRRVTEALRWIREHYTLEENPGLGAEGLYYYYLTFAKALEAWGEPTIVVERPRGAPGAAGGEGGGGGERGDGAQARNWRHDLIDRLATLQNEDGSFRSVNDRWMENDPVLITAYATLALEAALR